LNRTAAERIWLELQQPDVKAGVRRHCARLIARMQLVVSCGDPGSAHMHDGVATLYTQGIRGTSRIARDLKKCNLE